MRGRLFRRGRRGRPPAATPVAAPLAPGGGAVVDPGNLVELRKALAEDLAALQWDLGGLAYEMAIRDHYRIDVLSRRAAKLQEVDADLGVVERLLRLEEGGAAGTCPSCGALHSRGALFCEQCGTRLLPDERDRPPRLGVEAGAVDDHEHEHEAIDAEVVEVSADGNSGVSSSGGDKDALSG